MELRSCKIKGAGLGEETRVGAHKSFHHDIFAGLAFFNSFTGRGGGPGAMCTWTVRSVKFGCENENVQISIFKRYVVQEREWPRESQSNS